MSRAAGNEGIYENFDTETEFLVEDEVVEGVQDGQRKIRSDSLISIVSVHVEDVADYSDGDSDIEAIEIKDGLPATKQDTIINLSLNSRSLASLRRYLWLTLQWIPRGTTVSKRAFFTLMQIAVVGFFCYCYAFDMGAFKNRSLLEDTWKNHEAVTDAKNIIWSLRFLEMYILGLLYFRKRHLEKMLSEVRLTRRYWKKARWTIFKICLAVFLFVFVLPTALKVAQMSTSTKRDKSFKIKQVALNVTLSLLTRVFALPIFFAFIYVVYLIFCQIRLYKEQIQKWPEDAKEQARNRFLDIQSIIRDAERSFQTFLLTHLLLLLILLVPTVISGVERLEIEGQYKQTTIPTSKIGFSNPHSHDERGLANLTTNQAERIFFFLPEENTTLQDSNDYVPRTRSLLDAGAIAKIICDVLGDFLEMVMLYSVPLVFLAKVDKIMKSLPEVAKSLKFTAQKQDGYLFQNREVLEEMLKDLSTGRGMQVLRMDMTGVKAAMLTLLTPFLTTAVKLLMVHVEIT